MAQNGDAWHFASKELQNDKEVSIESALTQDKYVLEKASGELQTDEEVLLAAVTQNDWLFITHQKNCKAIRNLY